MKFNTLTRLKKPFRRLLLDKGQGLSEPDQGYF